MHRVVLRLERQLAEQMLLGQLLFGLRPLHLSAARVSAFASIPTIATTRAAISAISAGTTVSACEATALL